MKLDLRGRDPRGFKDRKEQVEFGFGARQENLA